MARIRTVKPGFFRSPDIAALPLTARLTFIGLWTYVDDEGRGVDDARLVKGDLWSLDDKQTVKKVEGDLDALARIGLIERWEANGRRYLRVVEWHHQRINRPTGSTIHPSLTELAVSERGAVTASSPPEGKGRERRGGGGGSTAAAALAESGLALLAERITNSTRRDNPARYQSSTLAGLRRERLDDALDLVEQHPDWTATDVAEALEPSHATVTVIRTPDPNCTVCAGTGRDPADPEIPCGCKWRAAS